MPRIAVPRRLPAVVCALAALAMLSSAAAPGSAKEPLDPGVSRLGGKMAGAQAPSTKDAAYKSARGGVPGYVDEGNAVGGRRLASETGNKCWAVARLKYGGGGDWYAGPSMLVNLSKRLRSDLGLPACADERQVGLLDGNLYEFPILFMTGHGNVAFSEEERKALREYLLRGGLLFADDNYGMDTSFRREMKILFPNHPMAALPNGHPVFASHWKFPNGLPKIHEHNGKRATAYVIAVEGRGVVFYSYESDLGNGWEDPEVHKDPPELHEAALRMGVNVVAWFLQGAPMSGVSRAPALQPGS